MLWTGIDRLATQLIQFVIGILIARVLLPSDYGLIGMLAIFMGVAQTFLDSGFANALIQKKDRNTLDYSTVFYFSIVIGLILYLLLYFAAPWIAGFYSQPILTKITRVYMLTLVINGFSIVHTAKMTIDLDFRSQAAISIVSILCSGGLGIWMAYSDYGVWALVWQGVCASVVRTILSWLFCRWLPLLRFSIYSFKLLFSFGSKLLGSSLINNIYSNLSTIIIGKVFHSTELGFFTRANQFCVLPTTTITNIVLKVNFPILSQLQDDNGRLVEAYKSLLRTPVWILYPILFGIAALSRPLILTLLGDNWLGSAMLIPILAFGCLWEPLTHINLNLLYVKGRSDLVLKLELMKKPIAFVMLLSAIPFGIIGMCISISLYSFVAFCFNCYYTGKMLRYGFGKQMKEILPILAYSVVMTIGVIPLNFLHIHPVIQLILGIATGMIIYLSLSIITHDVSYLGIRKIIKDKFHI